MTIWQKKLGGHGPPALDSRLAWIGLSLPWTHRTLRCQPLRPVDVYLTVLGDAAMPVAMKLAQQLRENGVKTDLEYKGRGLRAQMRTANKLNARYVVMIGEDEISNEAATVRDMGSGDQQSIAFSQLAETIREKVDS